MPVATRSASSSLAKDSRALWSSHSGANLRVNATPGATSVVVTNADVLSGTPLYAVSTPGHFEIVSCAAGATHHGKTSKVTAITGTTLTVTDDFSAILAAGDIIAVLPPPSVEPSMPSGHTVRARNMNDYSKALGQTFDTDNTPMTADVDGDIPFYIIPTAEFPLRALAAGVGGYKTVRTVADGATTNASAVVTSATATFGSSDVGLAITGAGIPASTTILSVDSTTQVTMSANATATATGVSITIGTAGTHYFRPYEASDGTFASTGKGTLFSQEGNAVVRQAFFPLFGTRLSLDIPEGGLGNGSLSVLGAGSVREMGGAGKTFTSGANAYLRSNINCDTGPRLSFRGAFVELGGSYGADLTSATSTTMQNVNVSIERGSIVDRTLGTPYIVVPEEDTVTIRVTGRGILNDDVIYEASRGATTDVDVGFKVETRMLVKLVSLADPTKAITIDIPRGVFSDESIDRATGRFKETFEFTALATIDGSTNCPSTATPIFQIRAVSSVTKNLLNVV